MTDHTQLKRFHFAHLSFKHTGRELKLAYLGICRHSNCMCKLHHSQSPTEKIQTIAMLHLAGGCMMAHNSLPSLSSKISQTYLCPPLEFVALQMAEAQLDRSGLLDIL